MRDRPAATDTDGVLRNYQRWRQLPSFEFIRLVFDLVKYAVNKVGIIAGGDDLGWRSLLLEVHFQDRIHRFIRRQRVLIKLVWGKLCRGLFVDDCIWDYLASGRFVYVPTDLPDLGL